MFTDLIYPLVIAAVIDDVEINILYSIESNIRNRNKKHRNEMIIEINEMIN